MIELQGNWVTDFHRALATPEWMAELERFITERVRAVGEIPGDQGSGTVVAEYTQERNLGPQSAVKYFFKVEAEVARPGDPSGCDQYSSTLSWDPETHRFTVRAEHATTVERDRAHRLKERMEAIKNQRELVETLRKTDCPICGRRLRIEFYPEGQTWWCRCPSGDDHFDREGYFRDWKDSPMSWKDHVADRTCPTCASPKDVVGILYGLIREPDQIDNKVWTLGGCCVGRERWHCKSCKTTF